mmetsp:Transcript_25817/g.65715  ORF Transcript_25817/g.65715 Transcript_25817/m.65715 type:complete len:219 (+) Transcript_25817:590-1246(+)
MLQPRQVRGQDHRHALGRQLARPCAIRTPGDPAERFGIAAHAIRPARHPSPQRVAEIGLHVVQRWRRRADEQIHGPHRTLLVLQQAWQPFQCCLHADAALQWVACLPSGPGDGRGCRNAAASDIGVLGADTWCHHHVHRSVRSPHDHDALEEPDRYLPGHCLHQPGLCECPTVGHLEFGTHPQELEDHGQRVGFHILLEALVHVRARGAHAVASRWPA